MKVKNLVIERRPSYDDNYPNMLVGQVQLEGEKGKMEVILSNGTLARIFALVKEDVRKTAEYNASQSNDAIEQAENEMPLLNGETIEV